MKNILFTIAVLISIGTPAIAETLRVGTKHAPPVVYTDKLRPSGFSVDIWEAAARDLDLQTEYKFYRNVSEIMEALREDDIDVAIGAISVTAEREARGIDFSFPYYQSGLQIIQSKDTEGIHIKLARHLGGWHTVRAIGSVLGFCCIFGTLIYLVERQPSSDFRVESTSPLKRALGGIGKGFWFSVVTLGTFGYGDLAPKTFKGRAIAVIWMGISFFVLANYISSVTERKLSASNQALSLRNASNKIGVINRTSADAFLARFPAQSVEFELMDEAIEALKAGKIDGVLTDAPIARYSVKQDSRLLADEELVSEEMYAIALKEGNDTLKEKIDQFLIGNITKIRAIEKQWTIQEIN